MFRSKRQTLDSIEPEAPRALAEDVAALHDADVAVPPEVDRAVLTAARERLRSLRPTQRTRPRPVLRWAPAAVGTVAVIVIAAFLVLPALVNRARDHARREAAFERMAVREDIDGSGEVDILDAFALARRIESGSVLKRGWDMNGDGAVDRADVDAVAHAAVRLERSTIQ